LSRLPNVRVLPDLQATTPRRPQHRPSHRGQEERTVKVAILGAGPCGLGSAVRLSELVGPDDWILVEQADEAGGLAGSVRDERGFAWDYGGHVLFTRINRFDQLMSSLLDECGACVHTRSAWAHVRGTWIRYPVQLHWPATVDGGGERQQLQLNRAPRHFDEWLQREFDPEVVADFFRPYNEKVWRVPPDHLSCQWVDDRVARTSEAPLGRRWGANAVFRYPRRGGSGEPWRTLSKRLLAEGCQLVLQSRVASVDLDGKQVHLESGGLVRFEWLISTLPLDVLLKMSSAPQDLLDRAARLLRTRTLLVGLGLRGSPQVEPDFTWLYFADHELPFYRVTQLSKYSPSNAPKGHWSLLAECSRSPQEPFAFTVSEVISGLQRVGVLGRRPAIESVWTHLLEYGYPVPTVDRDSVLVGLQTWLEERCCVSRGRFGAWKYEISNQDDAFMQGVDAAEHVLVQMQPTCA
jgi:protoporphyrinogen oxidase